MFTAGSKLQITFLLTTILQNEQTVKHPSGVLQGSIERLSRSNKNKKQTLQNDPSQDNQSRQTNKSHT